MDSGDEDENIFNLYKNPNDTGPTPIFPVKIKLEKKLFSRNHNQNQPPKVIGLSPAGISPSIATPSENYSKRGKKGDVVFRYKCKDSGPWEGDKTNKTMCEPRILKPTSSFLNDNDTFKFMFQKVKDLALGMDYVLQRVGTAILDKLEKDEKESDSSHAESFYGLPSLAEMSGEDHRYIGRIRSDGKLTMGSVYFEGCLDDSNGHIVTLDLSALDECHVFPGQIAVMEGRNEMGKCLRVSRMIEPESLPFETVTLDKKRDQLSIMIAVGPFTPNDSMKYEPLEDLIPVIIRDEPDVCILLGPFIEASHKMLEDVTTLFDEMFQSQLEHFRNKISETATKILLVPSYKDVHAQMVYPTPPFSIKLKQSDKRFVLLPDPATVCMNGIVISMTSTDALLHLKKNELANSTISGDGMGRLARHMLTQKSFYPLYPPEESVPLDVGHQIQYGRMEIRPHILIVPSDLRYFIKDVDGSIVVNPERLAKGNGGTFARILVDLSSVGPEIETLSSVADFCVGEIVKI